MTGSDESKGRAIKVTPRPRDKQDRVVPPHERAAAIMADRERGWQAQPKTGPKTEPVDIGAKTEDAAFCTCTKADCLYPHAANRVVEGFGSVLADKTEGFGPTVPTVAGFQKRQCMNVQCRVHHFMASAAHISLSGCPVCLQPGTILP